MKRIVVVLAALGLSASAGAAEPRIVADRVQARDGLVRVATGVRTPPLSADAIKAARTFALSHGPELGLAGAQLGEGRLGQTHLGTVIRMPVTLDGLPVLRHAVVVALDRQNRVRRVASSAEPIRAVSKIRRLDSAQALARAAEPLRLVPTRDGQPQGAAREVYFVVDGVARLSYEVHPASLSLLENWYAVVDAETGEVRSRENRVYRADGGVPDAGGPCAYDAGPRDENAKVWLPSPGATETAVLSTRPVPHLKATRDPSGQLKGELLDAYTCCPNIDCDPAQPARTLSGTATYMGFTVPFTTVFCDLKPRATNLLGCRTTYDYSGEEPLSIDPPTNPTPGLGDPADRDAFAEVHAYYHANLAYDYLRQVGDPLFVLRDSDPAQVNPTRNTMVWANLVTPDINAASVSFSGVTVSKFMRVDNSAYIPREFWAETLTPTNPTDLPQGDAITLWQGSSADFAYDGSIVYHEFTHGAVFSTANFAGPHVDTYGSLDEAGTMHEALADFYAAAITNDSLTAAWVGAKMPTEPNGDGAARELNSQHKCPDDLIGEVHHDSLPFSGALWELRTRHQGTDQGKTFDGAVFDALVSMVPASGFAEMAAATADAIGTAFGSAAHDDATAEFAQRGVTGCVKVLDYVAKRSQFYLNGTDGGYAPFAPGPLQFRIAAPQGASTVVVKAKYSTAAHQNPAGQASKPKLKLLANVGKQVTFSGAPSQLAHDAAASQAFAADANNATVAVYLPVTAAAGSAIYVAIVNEAAAQEPLSDVEVSLEVPVPPDAGPAGADAAAAGPDAAAAGPDASTGGRDAQASAADGGTEPKTEGCGCATSSASPALLAALGLWSVLRRRRG